MNSKHFQMSQVTIKLKLKKRTQSHNMTIRRIQEGNKANKTKLENKDRIKRTFGIYNQEKFKEEQMAFNDNNLMKMFKIPSFF